MSDVVGGVLRSYPKDTHYNTTPVFVLFCSIQQSTQVSVFRINNSVNILLVLLR